MKRMIVHPLLLALYPPLALLAHNVGQIEPIQAARSLVVSMLLAPASWLGAYVLLRSPTKAGITASAGIVVFFAYGHVYALVEDAALFGLQVGRHRYLLLLSMALVCACLLYLARRKAPADNLTKWLNVTSAVLVCLPLVQLCRA